MKKSMFLITLIVGLFINVYALDDGSGGSRVLGGLPKLTQLEGRVNYENMDKAATEAVGVLQSQEKVIQALDSHNYYGSLDYSDIDVPEIQRLISWKSGYSEVSPLFEGSAYRKYLEARTQTALEKYRKARTLDLNSLMTDNKSLCDNVIGSVEKNEKTGKETVLLLQYKLMDRMLSNEVADKEKYFTEVLSIRKQGKDNIEKKYDYIYQLFESRVRLSLLNNATEQNRLAIYAKAKGIGVKLFSRDRIRFYFSSPAKDTLSPEHKSAAVINMLELLQEGDSYCSVLPLTQLLDYNDIGTINVAFSDKAAVAIPVKAAAGFIRTDGKGQLVLDLDALLQAAAVNGTVWSTGGEGITGTVETSKQEAVLEGKCIAKSAAGERIARELNRYAIYLEAQSSKSSIYARDFEKNKKDWKTALSGSIMSFDPGGGKQLMKMADFILINKELADFYVSNKALLQNGGKDILKYRERVLRFKSLREGSLWLLDLTYELWNRGEI